MIFSFKEYGGFKSRDYEAAKNYIKELFVREKDAVESSVEYRSKSFMIWVFSL